MTQETDSHTMFNLMHPISGMLHIENKGLVSTAGAYEFEMSWRGGDIVLLAAEYLDWSFVHLEGYLIRVGPYTAIIIGYDAGLDSYILYRWPFFILN